MNLKLYEGAKGSLQLYSTVDEVKEIRDKALAIEAYAKQANDYQLERDAAAARVRAERRCGQLLREMEKAKGGNPQLVANHDRLEKPKTLAEMGVTKDQSSKWQKLAGVPDDQFEKALDNSSKISGDTVLHQVNGPPAIKSRYEKSTLFVWGTLRDLEKHGIFEMPIEHYEQDATEGMAPDFARIIPKLKKWCGNE